MAWNRKNVTYVVTDVPCYEVVEGDIVDRYVGAEPMAGFCRTPNLVVAACNACGLDARVVSVFEETKTLHGGYMARLLWQEVRDE